MTKSAPFVLSAAPAVPPVLLVFSHLRWGFVFQRPQHLLSRLAGRWRVIFVEEPVHSQGPARLQVHQETGRDGSTVQVLVPHTPEKSFGFHDDQLPSLFSLIAEYLKAMQLQVDVAWLYTPMALPLATAVQPACMVYDCMDDLAAFKDAPRQLRQRESALMKEAAFVLTGGPSLYESRRELHPLVVCLPSAVDSEHYAPANLVADGEHARHAKELQGALPGPRLGYFGVIDERMDLDLLTAMADAHPEWNIVMAGPVVKIDPAALPQRPNIHWLGMQPYQRLPYLLAAWDVALLPFALNDSTRFISPTKTLEYMAGEKPAVSTKIRDVEVLYGEAVVVAEDTPSFIAACESLLAATPAQRCQRAIAMLNLVAQHDWTRSADCVHEMLTLARQAAGAATAVAVQEDAAQVQAPRVASAAF
jgi:glycosyltransferase involved in cell wall biosynthesis